MTANCSPCLSAERGRRRHRSETSRSQLRSHPGHGGRREPS